MYIGHRYRINFADMYHYDNDYDRKHKVNCPSFSPLLTFFPDFFLAERECHSNLDCAGHYPCISHFPILHAMNRVMDDQFFVGMKKECFAAFDPTVGGM